jgi:hypothetical protein
MGRGRFVRLKDYRAGPLCIGQGLTFSETEGVAPASIRSTRHLAIRFDDLQFSLRDHPSMAEAGLEPPPCRGDLGTCDRAPACRESVSMRVSVLPIGWRIARCLLCWPLASVTYGQTPDGGPEYQIKAAYVFNFAKFTEWPASALPPGSTIQVCVAGSDPFGESLGALESKSVQNHPIRIRRDVRADGVRGCHVIFVTEADERTEQAILRAAEQASALTVGDRDGFVKRGGMIGMLTRDRRVLFEVNIEAGQRAGIKLSSQMLKLARSVKGRP